jgi:glucosylceramidase
MATEGINLWGFTVENEPLGNGNNWESMHFTPEEMSQFVQEYLGPELEKSNLDDLVILGYDQNRADLKEWVDGMFPSSKSKNYFDGTAVHWYESTYDYFPDELDYAHQKAPDKYLIQTEACVDSEIPVWKDDQWYWEKNATDWGYDWASDDKKYLHPKYIASHRYARDIIGCLNHWVDGWIDWNMILDRQGGPNWFKNWCVAPIIVDPTTDEIYYTPLYYIMSHFSKFIRPEARVLQTNHIHTDLMITAAVNKDKSLVIVAFNPTNNMITYRLKGIGDHRELSISPNAIQTIIVQP